jgi:ABC-type transporter Mla subunit MlaD
MRRLIAIALALLAGGAWLVTSNAPAADDGPYEIRAYFDNAGFLVEGEQVRVAGANVGTISSVDVSREDEIVSATKGAIPGKAVVVLKIDDPGFTDFRTDASCQIRPQSLLGEKFVDCLPTQPRSSGSEPPPPLEVIDEGELGEGQRFLPLENNGKAVDLDLLNNITREPEIDRFRLILNDLGAGLAARGSDLSDVLERANPALQETDKVLAILAEQNKGLAQLAADSETVLTPLARERESITGFINNANVAAEASAERRDDIAEGLERFPGALDELERNMAELQRFANEATPVASDLRIAAPALAGATKELEPFSRAGTTALVSLGQAAEAATPDLVASEPLIKQLRKLAVETAPGAKSLRKLFGSVRRTGGIDYLMEFILGTSNAFNAYDELGHILRANLLVTNCVEYRIEPLSGCGSNWTDGPSAAAATLASPAPTAETLAAPVEEPPEPEETEETDPATGEDEEQDPSVEGGRAGAAEEDATGAEDEAAANEALFDWLMGSTP